MELDKICAQVCKIAVEAGKFIKNEAVNFNKNKIEIKGIHNFVSYVDKESERFIIKSLQGLVEEVGFIAEENEGYVKGEKFNWIIDPLDGTTNFIHGLPCYCVSIALAEGNEIILGVIYEVNKEECFYSYKGGCSFLNASVIRVSEAKKMSDALIATGFPYNDYGKLNRYMEVLQYFMRETQGVRRLGSAALDMAYVACGRFEGFYEYGLQSWDVGAGIIIVGNAGGLVSDFRGGNDFLFGREIIASNVGVYDEMLKALRIMSNV